MLWICVRTFPPSTQFVHQNLIPVNYKNDVSHIINNGTLGSASCRLHKHCQGGAAPSLLLVNTLIKFSLIYGL